MKTNNLGDKERDMIETDKKHPVLTDSSGVGSWQEWARLVLDNMESQAAQLTRIEVRMEQQDKEDEACIERLKLELHELELKHQELKTATNTRLGIGGIFGIMIIILYEILKDKILGK